MGAFYYIRIVKVMYFDPPIDTLDITIPIEVRSILIITGFITIFLILYPMPLIIGAEHAAAALFIK